MNTIGKTGVLPLLIIRIIMARGMSFLEKSREGVSQKNHSNMPKNESSFDMLE
jgi:hypothetical protein